MGANSVTGTGHGSAEGNNQGSKSYTVGASRILGPRIVAAGHVTLSAGAANVIIPDTDGVAAHYIVQVSVQGGTAHAVAASFTIDANKNAVVHIVGTSSDTVVYSLIRIGVS